MLENLASAITAVVAFTNQHKVDAEFHLHSVGELKDGSSEQAVRWKRFEKNGGVYCIFDSLGEITKYIGMSHTDTGNRLVGWLFDDNKIKENLNEKDVVLSVVLKNDSYMASALEMFLIEKIEPSLNVTGKNKL